MPDNPQVPQNASQTTDWFKDAPGSDLNLDELFPNPDNPQATPAAPEPVPQPQAAPTADPQPFLKTSTGTVYKSVEDAIRGTEEKDRVIAQLRAQVAAVQGTDPLKKHPEPAPPQEPDSYVRNPSKYFKDLVEAANKGDANAYARAQQRFLMESLEPYAPLLGEVARERAIRLAEASPDLPMKDARSFLGSSDYQATLEKLPVLKAAIEVAERTPEMAGQLPQLYQLAQLASTGVKTPMLVTNAAASVASASPTTPRPTLTPSTPTPPPSSTPSPAGPAIREANLYSKEGRKAILDAAKERGLGDVDWSSVGL